MVTHNTQFSEAADSLESEVEDSVPVLLVASVVPKFPSDDLGLRAEEEDKNAFNEPITVEEVASGMGAKEFDSFLCASTGVEADLFPITVVESNDAADLLESEDGDSVPYPLAFDFIPEFPGASETVEVSQRAVAFCIDDGDDGELNPEAVLDFLKREHATPVGKSLSSVEEPSPLYELLDNISCQKVLNVPITVEEIAIDDGPEEFACSPSAAVSLRSHAGSDGESIIFEGVPTITQIISLLAKHDLYPTSAKNAQEVVDEALRLHTIRSLCLQRFLALGRELKGYNMISSTPTTSASARSSEHAA